MDIEAREAIREFYLSIRENHPNLSFSEAEAICKGPFLFARRMIESGLLPWIRLRYFATFKVKLGTAVKYLSLIDTNLEKGKISEEQYRIVKPSLEEYIKNHKKYTSEDEEDDREDNLEECDSLHTGESEI